jgi:hypothetical protein
LRSWLEVFSAKQGYEEVAEKGDGDSDQGDVFEHGYLSRSHARRYRIAAAKKTRVATVKMASFTKEE